MAIRTPRSGASSMSDTDLVKRSRSGDTNAFAELWKRHSRAGATVARSYTSTFDADDLVAESYAKIFQAIQAGGGPTGAFRPYLFTTIRNTAASWGRAKRETAIEDAEQIEDPTFSEENTLAALDRSLTATAFQSLPTRWQEALWYSEVESMTPQEIGPLLGMKANAIAALTYRAREGLRQAWIQAHLSSVPSDSECRWTIDHLGGYARNGLGKRDTSRVDEHLASCAKCTIVATEAKEVGSRLTLVLLPLAAGLLGATGYAAWLQSGSQTAVYALGPGGMVMPAAAVGGGSAGTGAGASTVASGGGTGAGATAGAGTAAGSAAAAGASGLVVGSIAAGVLVVAGVTAAIALGPTLFGGTPTSAPVAATPPAASQTSPSPDTITPQPPPSTALPPAVAPDAVQIAEPAASATVPAPAPVAPPLAPPVAPPAIPTVPGAPTVSSATVSPHGQLDLVGIGNAGNAVVATAQSVAASASRGFARTAVLPSNLEIGSTTVGADGSWRITADLTGLPNGGYTIAVVQSNATGASLATTHSIVLAIPPTAPTITAIDVGPVDGEGVGRYFPILSGTGIPGDIVTVSSGSTVFGTVDVDPDGTWATAQLDGFDAGDSTVYVTQSDRDGLESVAASASFTLSAPSLELRASSDEPIQYGFTVTVTGTPSAPFTLYADSDLWPDIGSSTLDDAGSFDTGAWSWQGATSQNSIGVRYDNHDDRYGVTISIPFESTQPSLIRLQGSLSPRVHDLAAPSAP
jgi:RNA polymerase sigma factor (sigma-70 family)